MCFIGFQRRNHDMNQRKSKQSTEKKNKKRAAITKCVTLQIVTHINIQVYCMPNKRKMIFKFKAYYTLIFNHKTEK